VKTPPYGKREHGSSDRRSQQDKIARAACRPPLRPNGNSKFSIFVRNLRKVVGRGRTPPQGCTDRRGVVNRTPDFPVHVGAARTPAGNVAAARTIAGNANLHGGVRPRPTGWQGTGDHPAKLHYIRKPPGRPAGRPYGRTEIRNFRFLFSIYG